MLEIPIKWAQTRTSTLQVQAALGGTMQEHPEKVAHG
jgi:hypothetical protein